MSPLDVPSLRADQLDEGIPGGDYPGSQRAAFAYIRQPNSPDTSDSPELLICRSSWLRLHSVTQYKDVCAPAITNQVTAVLPFHNTWETKHGRVMPASSL